jgi:hypothetical protein
VEKIGRLENKIIATSRQGGRIESGNLSHPDVQYEYFSFSQGVVFGD